MIEGFRKFSGTVEIVGLGGVSQPSGEAQEAEVAVLVASVWDQPDQGTVTEVKFARVGCGQLDLLVPGSRWRAGRHVGQADAVTISALFEFARDERLGAGADPQPARARPFPSRPIAAAPGFLLSRVRVENEVEAGRSNPRGPDLILLPQMELLRSLFGVSNGFLLELFDGIRNPAVSGERGLVDRARSSLRPDGTAVLMAGRVLSRDEALIAAAIVTDKALRRLHDSAFQQLSVSSEWHEGRSEYIDLRWPWQVPIPLELEGRWVTRTDKPTRFAVTRILSIGVPLPFTRVEVHHPGTESGAHGDLPPSQGRIRPPNARVVVLTTGRAASPSRRPVEIGTRAVGLSEAVGIEIVSVPRGGIARRDRGGIGEEPRDRAPFGTGGRMSGADSQVGAAVVRRNRSGSVSPDTRNLADALNMTWSALRMACESAKWELDALPTFSQPSRGARHGGLDLSREPLVARVEFGSRRLLVVDRGSPAGDECSLGILVPRDARVSDQALAVSARKICTSIGGRWRSPTIRRVRPAGFDIIAINRGTEVWQDAAAYARMLERRIALAFDT